MHWLGVQEKPRELLNLISCLTMQSSSAQVTMQSQNQKRALAWTEREILDLIAVWGEESMLSELHSKRRNAKTFQKISEAMRDRGYSRDATQCRLKLKELRQAHQKTKESNGCPGTEPQTCRFYAELHAILGGAATTTPPLSVDYDDGVLSAMPEDFADRENEEDELEARSQHTVLPDSQDLFITLTEIPSQPNEAGEGTSEAANVSSLPPLSQRLSQIRLRKNAHAMKCSLSPCSRPALTKLSRMCGGTQ
ncbi:zinc finger protein with KRAB and SCAN domains 2-like [Caretta caretta]|uniref:zinc finger protein with KRAB and SCAN domains 2-like n=1 Tax=Caretta caretta TaxID=8467 RepID=UPI003F4C985F